MRVPLDICDAKWSTVAIDLTPIIEAGNPQAQGHVEHSIKTMVVSGNLDIKSIYTSDNVYGIGDFPDDVRFRNIKIKTVDEWQ